MFESLIEQLSTIHPAAQALQLGKSWQYVSLHIAYFSFCWHAFSFFSLDWTYYDTQPKSIEVYEHIHGEPRRQLDLIMSREERQTTLMEDWNVSYVEIARAVRETFKVRNQRRRSVHNIGKAQKLDTFLESAQRKLKRTLLFQKRSSSQVQCMMQQAEEAAAFLAKVTAANNSDRMIEDPSAAAWENDGIAHPNDESEPRSCHSHTNQIRIAANSAWERNTERVFLLYF